MEHTISELDAKLATFTNEYMLANDTARRKWCVQVLQALFETLKLGDKIYIYIHHAVQQRPHLARHAASSGIVKLNVSVSAVSQFAMDTTGMAFSYNLNNSHVFDVFDWAEITTVEINRLGKEPELYLLNPQALYFSYLNSQYEELNTQITTTVREEQPVVEDNVVRVDFRNRK